MRGLIVLNQRRRWYRDEIEVARGSFVSRNAVIGRRTRINGRARIDLAHIGPYCEFGNNVSIRTANHETKFLNMSEITQRLVIGGRSVLTTPAGPNSIGAGCWLGDNVVVLEGVDIGTGAVVGAGAVVTKSVPAYAIAVGNPAKVIRYRYPPEIVAIIEPVEWWTWSDEKLRENRDLFDLDLTTVEPEHLRRRLDSLR